MIRTLRRSITSDIPSPETQALLSRLSAVEPRSMHGQLPIVWRNAHGHEVEDIQGNRFIDFTSGIFVANIGHANAAVAKAVCDYAMQPRPLHSYTYATGVRLRYLEELTSWSGFDKAFLVSSGTEATEAALRIMRAWGVAQGKRAGGVVCVAGNYHGRTMGAHLMSGKTIASAYEASIHHIPFPYPWDMRSFGECLKTISQLDFDKDLCGFMLETFQGWCAAFYPPAFVQSIADFCKAHNLLLCFDEMQAGFGRTGKKFGYEHYGVKPDLICVGKAMGGGLPLSGVLADAEVMDVMGVGDMSSTHGGNPLCCVAGLATLKELERLDLVREAERKGRIIEEHGIQRTGGMLLGRGLIRALVFPDNISPGVVQSIVEHCYRKGLLLVNTGRPSIKIGPPLTIPDDALIEGLDVLRASIMECTT